MKTFEMKLRGFGMFSLVAMSALPLFFASCSSDNDPVETESEVTDGFTEIQLSGLLLDGNIGEWNAKTSNTRSATTGPTTNYLSSGETINLTVNKYNTTGSVETQLYQQTATVSGNSGVLTTTTRMFYPYDDLSVDVYGYKNCSIPEVGSGDNKTTPVKNGISLITDVNLDQSTAANYNASDFLWAQATNQSRSDSNITLTLAHMMARIKLDIKGTSEVAGLNLKLKQIKLGSVIYKSTYTVNRSSKTENVTAGNTTGDIILFKSENGVTINKDLSESCKAILVPQKLTAAKTITLETVDSKGNAGKSFTFEIASGKEFEQGKSYTYTVTVSTQKLTVEAKITDWDEVTAEEIDAEYNFGN
jgi:hypothetical protein